MKSHAGKRIRSTDMVVRSSVQKNLGNGTVNTTNPSLITSSRFPSSSSQVPSPSLPLPQSAIPSHSHRLLSHPFTPRGDFSISCLTQISCHSLVVFLLKLPFVHFSFPGSAGCGRHLKNTKHIIFRL